MTDINKLTSNDPSLVKEAVDEFLNHKLNDLVDTKNVREVEKRELVGLFKNAMNTNNLELKTVDNLSFAVAFLQQLKKSEDNLGAIDGGRTLLRAKKSPLDEFSFSLLSMSLNDSQQPSHPNVVDKAKLSVFRQGLESPNFLVNRLGADEKKILINQIDALLGDRSSPDITPSEDNQALSNSIENATPDAPINFDTNAPKQDSASSEQSKSSLNFKK